MRCSPSTKTRTPATGAPSASVTLPLTTFGRSSTTRSPSSGTVPSPASWPSAETDTVAPRSAVRVATPSASVRALVPSTSSAARLDGLLAAAGDDADRHLARLLRGRLGRRDEREVRSVLAACGQEADEGQDHESEPERAAGQQGQVLSTGGSVSASASARAAARRAATVGARSPAVLYRALPTTSTSPPPASATPIVSRFTPPSTPI